MLNYVNELVNDGLAVRFVAVKLETDTVKAELLQPTVHYLQRGSFLANKEHALPLTKSLRNNIHNGLALARSWRSLDDQTLPAPHPLPAGAAR